MGTTNQRPPGYDPKFQKEQRRYPGDMAVIERCVIDNYGGLLQLPRGSVKLVLYAAPCVDFCSHQAVHRTVAYDSGAALASDDF